MEQRQRVVVIRDARMLGESGINSGGLQPRPQTTMIHHEQIQGPGRLCGLRLWQGTFGAVLRPKLYLVHSRIFGI